MKKRYILSGSQCGEIYDLGNPAGYTNKSEAISAAHAAWRAERAHPDFTRGGEDRFTWRVQKECLTVAGEWEYFTTVWERQADAR